MKRVSLIVGAGAAEVAEAFRGAVGLTLRGDRITVVVDPHADTTGTERAQATLAMFGHRVGGPELLGEALEAEAVEVWGVWHTAVAAAAPRTGDVLHVVRAGRTAHAVAPADRVVRLDDVDDDQLLDHVLAAGSIAVW